MKIASSLAIGLLAVGCNDIVLEPGMTPVDMPPTETARVRVAHLSPDAPAVDFCLAAHGTGTWIGPVLAGADGPLGLSYGQVTKYLDVGAARYDVRLVAPASADCSRGLVADFSELPELTAGVTATIAATGDLAHGGAAQFTLRAFIDDATVEPGKAKLRFIHASPGTPDVDVGIGGGALYSPVFTNVAYGSGSYITSAPAKSIELSARASGGAEDVLSIKPATLAADSIATAFAIGEIGNASAPLRVLFCKDSGAPHMLFSECSIVGGPPERAAVRIAHLSPDAPAVDVCLAPTGTNAWQGPLLASLGAVSGLAYSKVTAYVHIPVATYDARIVVAGATDCSAQAVPDTIGIGVLPGLRATVAAIGVLDRSGTAAHDGAFRLKVFGDDGEVSAGKAKLRFIHASPGTPAVDVGLGSGNTFTTVFDNVAFGDIARNSPMNDNGYIETSPFTSPVSARVADTTCDAITAHVSTSSSSITTAFAVGGKTGDATNPLRVLICADNAPPFGVLTQCTLAP